MWKYCNLLQNSMSFYATQVPIMSVGILHICNLWILRRKIVISSAKNFIFIDFFAVKVDGSAGICKEVFMSTDSCYVVTSFNFNSKKVYEDEIFGWQGILQLFSAESEDYKYLKSPYPHQYALWPFPTQSLSFDKWNCLALDRVK